MHSQKIKDIEDFYCFGIDREYSKKPRFKNDSIILFFVKKGNITLSISDNLTTVCQGCFFIASSWSNIDFAPGESSYIICVSIKRPYFIQCFYRAYGSFYKPEIFIRNNLATLSGASLHFVETLVSEYDSLTPLLRNNYGIILIHRIVSDMFGSDFEPSSSVKDYMIESLTNFIVKNINEDINIDFISNKMGVSRKTVFNRFDKIFGDTPRNVINKIKIDLAFSNIVSKSNTNITQLALELGFSSPGRFSSMYFERIGELPSETKRRFSVLTIG